MASICVRGTNLLKSMYPTLAPRFLSCTPRMMDKEGDEWYAENGLMYVDNSLLKPEETGVKTIPEGQASHLNILSGIPLEQTKGRFPSNVCKNRRSSFLFQAIRNSVYQGNNCEKYSNWHKNWKNLNLKIGKYANIFLFNSSLLSINRAGLLFPPREIKLTNCISKLPSKSW